MPALPPRNSSKICIFNAKIHFSMQRWHFLKKWHASLKKNRTNPLRFLNKIKDHHEIGLQTSYRQKKTTILQHFSSPESWYHSFHEIMQKLWFLACKNHFFEKWKKSTSKKIGGSGGQSPPAGWKGCLRKSKKASRTCLNPSEHVKSLRKPWKS